MGSAVSSHRERRAISPYARKLASTRGVLMEHLTGSGPNGRIVAADVIRSSPPQGSSEQRAASAQVFAFAASIELEALDRLLGSFKEVDMPFEIEDLALRAAACALDDVPAASPSGDTAIALEAAKSQIVFSGASRRSLTPLRAQRLAALDANQPDAPAALSLRLLRTTGVRPVMMPLAEGRSMRLVLVLGQTAAECLLSCDAAVVSEDAASELLGRFKAYLERPILLLA